MASLDNSTSGAAKLQALGSMRWDDAKMQETLPEDVYNRFKDAMKTGAAVEKADRKVIAAALFKWATSIGACNFAHWFAPVRSGAPVGLGGTYAIKHDTMVDLDYGSPLDLKPLTATFPYDRVFIGESDGSSFPNGGLRQTHTAAGFTAWDINSPPFVYKETLYLPTVFVSHYGMSLDEKTPLLRSQEAVSKHAVKLLKLIGYQTEADKVVSNVGWEQEFFVVTKENFLKRPDLRHCGRTLIGRKPERGQQTDLNYFGPVPQRVHAFLAECQSELLALGVSMAVYHNEVAPGQHEVSPIFSLTNVATDQNEICLEVMADVATKHGLVVLNHEKPFAGLNGSGKHLNWGINTNTGKNLLVPGKTPEAQTAFMTFVAALAYAVKNHGDCFRVGVASAGNDHRLGAQEAPPAIITMYCGMNMEAHIDSIIAGGELTGYGDEDREMDARAVTGGPISTRGEDRNRTSPFPFCGNRFEFRACGSSQNIAFPLAMVNSAMADGCKVLCEKIEGGMSVRDAVADVFRSSRNALFSGNGYDPNWPKVATEERGLANLVTTPDAIDALVSDKNKALFDTMAVFTHEELEARQEIMYEAYTNALTVEGETLVTMMNTAMIPACAQDLSVYKDAPALAGSRAELYGSLVGKTEALKAAIAGVPEAPAAAARHCLEAIKPAMEDLRAVADECEGVMSNYPFPNYTDVLLSHHVDAAQW